MKKAPNEHSQAARILVFDRKDFANSYRPNRRYALLSIRHPGSRFPQSPFATAMLSRCDLMLHEWNLDYPPFPLSPTVLQPRQAIKIADWLKQQSYGWRLGDIDLVIQSECASSQAAAILNVIESVLDGDASQRIASEPHEPTRVLLEMAIDICGLLERPDTPHQQAEMENRLVTSVWSALGFIFQHANIDFVVSPSFSDLSVADRQSANVATRQIVKTLINQHPAIDGQDAPIDFLARMLLIRNTRLCVTMPACLEKLCPGSAAAFIVGDMQPSEIKETLSGFTGPVHLIHNTNSSILETKSRWYSIGRYLLESRLASLRLLTLTHDRDIVSELMHRRLRRNN